MPLILKLIFFSEIFVRISVVSSVYYYYCTKFSETLFDVSKNAFKISGNKAENICAVMGHTIKILNDEQLKNSAKETFNVKKGAEYHLCQRVYKTLQTLPEDEKKKLKYKIVNELLDE